MIRIVESFRPVTVRKCPVCHHMMRYGQTVVWVNAKTIFHRRCLTEFLDHSYDQHPILPNELEGDDLFPQTAEERLQAKEVRDLEKAEREREKFNAYRMELARRMGVSAFSTEGVDAQLTAGLPTEVMGDMP